MRLIDAEDSKLQTQLKIIREAEYQIYGSGSWGFTAKCERAIEDAPTVQPESHEIGYYDCSNALLKMWMDNVLIRMMHWMVSILMWNGKQRSIRAII